jgi:hypothetical protein
MGELSEPNEAQSNEAQDTIRKPIVARIRELLSKPWIGPSISLVVLTVSTTALVISISTFFRQGDRWSVEDARIGPQVYFALEGSRPDGWRRGVLQITNRLDVRLQLQYVEVVDRPNVQIVGEYVSPDGLVRRPIIEKASGRFELNQTVPAHTANSISSGSWGAPFFIKPTKQGDEIIMRFVMWEVAYPHRAWTRETSTTASSP